MEIQTQCRDKCNCEVINIMDTVHYSYGCDYGKADGPDDFIKECDCGYYSDHPWIEAQ